MSVNAVAQALTSPLKRKIIALLCSRDMTAVEIFRHLRETAPKYRQSVNKALESLKEAGLVRKYYNDTRKQLYYGIIKKRIIIVLETMSIE